MPPCVPSPARGVRPLVLLALAVLGAGGRPAAAQRITPRFAWPAGARATVTTTVRSTNSFVLGMEARTDSAQQTTTATLTVRPDPRGLRVDFAPDSAKPAAVPGFGSSAAAYVLARDGRFLDLADTLAVARRIDSSRAELRSRFGANAEMPPSLLGEMEQGLTVTAVRELASLSWASLVGDWVGRAWSAGDSLASVVRQPFPVLAGMTIEVPRTLHFEGEAPCPAGRRGRCLRLVEVVTHSADAMRAIMRRIFAASGEDADLMMQHVPATTTTSRMVHLVDAATFLPYRSEGTFRSTSENEEISMTRSADVVTVFDWR